MFQIIKNQEWRRNLWVMVLVGGGLIGLGTMAGKAQAADYRNYYGRPATSYVATPNLNTSAAQINSTLQTIYNRQHMPGWDWQRTYPWSPYNIYNPYNPYSPYNNWNYPYYPNYPYYSNYPVIYPYGSSVVVPGSSPIYPNLGTLGGLGVIR
jgi:hypothetical protein